MNGDINVKSISNHPYFWHLEVISQLQVDSLNAYIKLIKELNVCSLLSLVKQPKKMKVSKIKA